MYVVYCITMQLQLRLIVLYIVLYCVRICVCVCCMLYVPEHAVYICDNCISGVFPMARMICGWVLFAPCYGMYDFGSR